MTEPSMTELKAYAYDLIAQKEHVQRQLDQVNARISELFQREQAQERNPDRPLGGGVMPCADDTNEIPSGASEAIRERNPDRSLGVDVLAASFTDGVELDPIIEEVEIT